ncbi:MAG: HAD family phosphatase [Spirochaetae bacterium HGW-Spirochaetae-7]|nr:MAG: HAD family phosphatase [Spirochaetae bacterium HGW-Spirochaetae-7]
MMLYIFDMGGVLARDFDIAPEASRLLGLTEREFRRFAACDMDSLMAGTMSAAEWWSRFAARSGAHPVEDLWSTLFAPTVDDEVEWVIGNLRKHGRVVCGTNTIASHYDWLKTAGRYEPFDEVYASHLLGVCKPDPAFWLRILEAEGVNPCDAFFVDDMAVNVKAAEGVGIASHLFTDVQALKSALESTLAGEARLEA